MGASASCRWPGQLTPPENPSLPVVGVVVVGLTCGNNNDQSGATEEGRGADRCDHTPRDLARRGRERGLRYADVLCTEPLLALLPAGVVVVAVGRLTCTDDVRQAGRPPTRGAADRAGGAEVRAEVGGRGRELRTP